MRQQVNNKMDDVHLEGLAALEHEQWAHWTEYMIKKLEEDAGEEGLPLGCVPILFQWKKQIKTPYSKLSDKEKDSDRIWATKVKDFLEDRTYDIAVHHGTCGFCSERNALVVHYNYSKKKQEARESVSLCPKCIGRGLVALQHPLTFPESKETKMPTKDALWGNKSIKDNV
jgi:hypothetical protein